MVFSVPAGYLHEAFRRLILQFILDSRNGGIHEVLQAVVNLEAEEGEKAHKGVDDNTTLDCPGLAKPPFIRTYIVPRLYTV